ncbi:MAG: hypothetical protein ACREU8_10130 [Gammaproteobacteria bacterium]
MNECEVWVVSSRAHRLGLSRGLLASAFLVFAGLWTTTSWAIYINRYSTTNRGAVSFTGNTLGLSKQSNANAPGTADSIGTFITTNLLSQDGTYPFGTTANWQLNNSSAVLNLPVGSTVLYAELIWDGSSNHGGENVTVSTATAGAGYKSVKLTTDADSSLTVTPGDTVTFSVFHINTGSAGATAFQITDPLPPGLTITAPGAQTVTTTQGICTFTRKAAYTGTGANTALLAGGAVLGAGCAVRVDIPVTVDPGVNGTLSNQATATAIGLPPAGVATDNVDNATPGLPPVSWYRQAASRRHRIRASIPPS